MLAQVESADLPGRFQQSNRDPEDILQKLTYLGLMSGTSNTTRT